MAPTVDNEENRLSSALSLVDGDKGGKIRDSVILGSQHDRFEKNLQVCDFGARKSKEEEQVEKKKKISLLC